MLHYYKLEGKAESESHYTRIPKRKITYFYIVDDTNNTVCCQYCSCSEDVGFAYCAYCNKFSDMFNPWVNPKKSVKLTKEQYEKELFIHKV